MSRTANRFTRGSGVYECRCCGRRTRDTGRGDNEGVELCAECYDLAGFENLQSDQGLTATECLEIASLLAQLATRPGADVSVWRDTFTGVPFDFTTNTKTGATMNTTTKTRELSQSPAAQKARERRAAKKASAPATTLTYDDVIAEIKGTIDSGTSLTMADLSPAAQAVLRERHPNPEDLPLPDFEASANGVFGAMAQSLSTSAADAAVQTQAAISKAQRRSTPNGAKAKPAAQSGKGAAPATAKKPAGPDLTLTFKVGAYKGRAGAMFAFMGRVTALGGAVSREKMIDSCRVTAPHPAVSTRAQVLDYFTWAVRHGLLVPANGGKKAKK